MAKRKPKPELKKRVTTKASSALDFLKNLSGAPALPSLTSEFDDAPVIEDSPSDFDIKQYMRDIMKEQGSFLRDLKFDDSAMPTAANFYEWTTGSEFLNADPYLEQVLIGLRLFSEYCPRCSDTHWMQIENHEPQEGLAGLRKNVVLLHNGVCPKCGARRTEMMKSKELPVYTELGVLAGQRCVSGNSHLLTESGLVRFGSLDLEEGYTKTSLGVHNGQQVANALRFYRGNKQQTLRVRLSNGYTLIATGEHHVATPDGQIAISHLDKGSTLCLKLGTQVFGSAPPPAAFKAWTPEMYAAHLGTLLAQGDKDCLNTPYFTPDGYLNHHILSAPETVQRNFIYGVFSAGPFVSLDKRIADSVYAMLYNLGHPCRVFEADKVTIACYDRTTVHTGIQEVTIVDISAGDIEDVYDLYLPLGNKYVADGIVHHNSGKSIAVAMLSSYLTHRILKMQKPTRVYNVGDNQMLQGTFVALTKDQAKDTLWEPYFGYLVEAPWFKRYHELMKRYDAIYGTEMLKLRDTFVMYRHRNLTVYYAGPDKRTLRGRCVTGSTIVNTDRGFLHFDEMVNGSLGFKEVRNLTVDSHRGNRKVSHTYKDRSRTIKAVTRNGYEIEGTPEHPMLVMTRDIKLEWRRLDELRIGDRIVSRTAKNSPVYGKNDVDFDAATIAGYLVANGFRNTVSSDDPVVIKTLSEAFTRLTGYSIRSTSGVQGVRAATHSLSIEGNRRKGGFLSNYMRPLGYSDAPSAHKSIPVGIRGASKEILHEFLEAYFQCDSGINGGSTKSSSSNAPCEIEVGSASKKLAHQLHVILLHAYGIVGRLTKQVSYDKLDRQTGRFDTKRVHHLITITGGDAWKFLQTFKRAKVQKYADRFADTPLGYCSDRRNVPYVREFVYSTFEAARKVDSTAKRLRKFVAQEGSEFSWPNAAKPRAFKHLRYTRDLSDLDTPEFLIYQESWEQMLQLMAKADPKAASRVRKLIKLGAHFEEVTHIKHGSKMKTVYDITVPEGHAFTANGLASHNTRVFYSIDEIGWFDNDAAKGKVKTGATEVSIALERSCLTVRAAERNLLRDGVDDFLLAYGLNISSPSDYRDKICEIIRLSKTSNKVLGIHAPTWKMNPNITRDDPTIVEEYRKNPIAAARDYGAEPPVSANPFISPLTVNDAMREKGINGIRYRPEILRKRGPVPGSVEKNRYATVQKIKEIERPSILTMDAGETNNSFALTCGSIVDDRPQIDLCIEVMPLPGIPLNYSMIFDAVIAPVCKARNVKILLADRWNSTKILQDAQQLGLVEFAKKYSLKYSDMWDAKNAMEAKMFTYPKSEHFKNVSELLNQDLTDYPACFEGKPVEHFMYQCITIQDSGRSVLKGTGVTDDLWRAGALLHYGLTCPEYVDIMSYHANKVVKKQGPIMILGKREGAASSTAQSSTRHVGNFAAIIKSRGTR